MRRTATAALVVFAVASIHSTANAQVRPYRAAPPCKGQCGSPLCGPCVADTPYAYVPTRWRRWPVTQASATMAPEELPSPTPAKAPQSADEAAVPDQVPQLPMTPDLPEPATGLTPQSSAPLAPPFGDIPPAGNNPQVPLFGDEPQAPPSAADPLRSPFQDEPPQPPADEESELGTKPAPATMLPANPGGTAPGLAPTEAPQSNTPESGMPFDVGPPQMPNDDPFRDDPNQQPTPAPKAGARLEQAYRETYGIARNDAPPAMQSPPVDPSGTQEPRLLRADGGSFDAARLPDEQAESNPLRQVSHPGRRTMATEQLALPPSKPAGSLRKNPLRER